MHPGRSSSDVWMHYFCVIISMALWLEIHLEVYPAAAITPFVFSFSDNVEIPSGGKKSKETVQGIFGQDMFKRPEFIDDEGPLGTHSIRKYASTHTRKNGCTKDEKISEGGGKERGGLLMFTMMLSYRTQMQKWRRNYVLEELASM
jgi:hypothetical protein